MAPAITDRAAFPVHRNTTWGVGRLIPADGSKGLVLDTRTCFRLF
jgi:hypothetical protein